MTIFTSTARENVNRTDYYAPDAFEAWPVDTVRPEDPEPWKDDFGGRYASISDIPDRYSAIFDPRPGYRAPQNPVLVAFRIDCADPSETIAEVAEWYLLDLYDSGNLPDHIDHARKVLTRLANAYKED